MESGPFLIIQCETVPAPVERPFLVADCVAIWLHENDALPSDLGFYCEFSTGEIVALPYDLATLLRPFTIPSDETLDAIAQLLFPEALHVSCVNCFLIFEYPVTNFEGFARRLETLPTGVSYSSVSLNYVKGPLILSSHCRIVKPNPRLLKGRNGLNTRDWIFLPRSNDKLKNRRSSYHRYCHHRRQRERENTNKNL